MTAYEKLLQKVIRMCQVDRSPNTPTTGEAVRAEYERLWGGGEFDAVCEAEGEIRRGEVETGIPCCGSRHYEAKSVAARMLDGSYVGWVYWYGGGKHGAPADVPWMEDAYDVVVREETRVVQVFSRAVEDET